MKRKATPGRWAAGVLTAIVLWAGGITPARASYDMRMRVSAGDTLYFAPSLPTLVVYPPMRFKNKRQEQFYWKTVRDVKKVLPYAKIAGKLMREADEDLSRMTTNKEKRDYMKAKEDSLVASFRHDILHMTRNQGRILIKLIDRECGRSSYEIIQIYRGNAAAVFWQGIAKIFGENLKDEYDYQGNDKDAIIERVIEQVEAGLL